MPCGWRFGVPTVGALLIEMGDGQVSEHDETCEDAALTLADLATTLLGEAREHHSRRSANTILSGDSMRATVIALAAGAELGEHEAPPAATLQPIVGEVDLVADDDHWLVTAGQLIAIPPRRHSLRARSDAAVLLTVALH